MKRHIAPQFDLPGTEYVFNLSGDKITPEASQTPKIPCSKFSPICGAGNYMATICANCGEEESLHPQSEPELFPASEPTNKKPVNKKP